MEEIINKIKMKKNNKKNRINWENKSKEVGV